MVIVAVGQASLSDQLVKKSEILGSKPLVGLVVRTRAQVKVMLEQSSNISPRPGKDRNNKMSSSSLA